MKIKYLLLSLFVTAFASCTQQKCDIEGVVQNAMDGDTLFIARMTDGNLIPSDTVILKDGKFTLHETCDSTVIACFYYYDRQTKEVYSSLFFIEDGKVELQVRQDCKIAGTENNDIYQHFMDSIYDIHEQMSEIYTSQEMTDTTDIEAEDPAIIGKMAELDKKSNDLVMRTVRTYIDKPAGYVIFLSCYNMFKPHEILQLIDKVSPHYKGNEVLNMVRKEAENSLAASGRTSFIDVTIPSANGENLQLSEVVKAHKLTLVDCWASWCGPCRAEMPNVVALYDKFKSKGLEIVGISFDDNEEAWKNAVRDMNRTWLQCSELNGWDNVMTQKYGISSIPYTLLIDNEGNILAQQLRGKELEHFVEEYFK